MTTKPCPWCGSTSVSVVEGSTFRWCVAECDGCGARCGEVRIQTLGDGTPEEWEQRARSDAMNEWNDMRGVKSVDLAARLECEDLALGLAGLDGTALQVADAIKATME